VVLERVERRDRHVRVDVPVVEAVYYVDAALVVFEHVGQEIAFLPVAFDQRVLELVPAKDVAVGAVDWPSDVIGAGVLQVLVVAVGAESAVDHVVHERRSRLGGAVAPHQLAHANQPRNGDDGFQVRVAELRRLPLRRAVVRFPNDTNVAVAPVLRAKPRHRRVDP